MNKSLIIIAVGKIIEDLIKKLKRNKDLEITNTDEVDDNCLAMPVSMPQINTKTTYMKRKKLAICKSIPSELKGIYSEKLTLSNHIQRGKDVHSKLIPGSVFEGGEIFICPRCETERDVLEHRTKTKCDKCNLGLLAYNNALYIWETQPEL